MEIKQLSGFVLMLVLVGMVLGVGILVQDQFGTATRDTVDYDEAANTSGGTFTVAQTPIYTVARFGNATVSNTTFNCIGCAVNYTAATGVFIVDNTTFSPSIAWAVNYTAYENSTTTDTMTNMRAAISPIATTWLALIVTIVVLSIILGLVIRSFNTKR